MAQHTTARMLGACFSMTEAQIRLWNVTSCTFSWAEKLLLVYPMATESCAYDCARPPTELAPYADISGIGVSVVICSRRCSALTMIQICLSYTVTAGLALCLVMIYYVLDYNPCSHPLSEGAECGADLDNMAPANAIDQLLLSWRFKKCKCPRACYKRASWKAWSAHALTHVKIHLHSIVHPLTNKSVS